MRSPFRRKPSDVESQLHPLVPRRIQGLQLAERLPNLRLNDLRIADQDHLHIGGIDEGVGQLF